MKSKLETHDMLNVLEEPDGRLRVEFNFTPEYENILKDRYGVTELNEDIMLKLIDEALTQRYLTK